MKNRSISLRFDDETYRIAENLARLSNKSIPGLIKDLIKDRGQVSEHRISKRVKKISGIIKTDIDYKSLRDMITSENIDKYERLH